MQPIIAHEFHAARVGEIERHVPAVAQGGSMRLRDAEQRRRRSLVRAVGRTIVRIGQAIEAEPRQPVASL